MKKPDAQSAHWIPITNLGQETILSVRERLAKTKIASNARRESVQQLVERVSLLPLDCVTGVGDHLNFATPERGCVAPTYHRSDGRALECGSGDGLETACAW
jgi:hypothetical protein